MARSPYLRRPEVRARPFDSASPRGVADSMRGGLIDRGPYLGEPAFPDDARLPRFQPYPTVFGECRAWPVTATVPSLAQADGATIVRVVKTFGRGPLQLSNLRWGDTVLVPGRLETGKKRTITTPIGVLDYECVEGRGGDAGFTIYPLALRGESFTYSMPTTQSKQFKNFPTWTTPDATSVLDVGIKFPRGISVLYNGKYNGKTAVVRVAARKAGTSKDLGDDGTKYFERKVVGNDDNLEINAAFLGLELGTAQAWEIGVYVYYTASNLTLSAQWVRVLARGVKSPAGLTGCASIAVGGDLANFGGDDTLSKLNADAVPELKAPGSWAVAATSSPAAAFRDVLQGAMAPRVLADARIDLVGLAAWDTDCVSRGLTFRHVFGSPDGPVTVPDALRMIAAAGGAALSEIDGVYGVVREPNPSSFTVAGHFCPRNAWGFREARTYVQPPHALKATFVNAGKQHRPDTRIVYAPGYSQATATLFEAMTFDGARSEAAIDFLAAQALAAMLKRSVRVTFETDWAQLRVVRGDVVRVAAQGLEWGQDQGRVRRVLSTTRVLLDEAVRMVVGSTYRLLVVSPDGSEAFKTAVVVPGTRFEVETTTAHGAAEGDLCFFGVTDEEAEACVVLGVEPTGDFGARLTVSPLDPSVYTPEPGSVSTASAMGSATKTLAPPVVESITLKGKVTLNFGGGS